MHLSPMFAATAAAAVMLFAALAAAEPEAQDGQPGDEGGGGTVVKEKKVAYTFAYHVKTHGEGKGAAKKGAKPAKPAKKAKGVAPAEEPAPAAEAKPDGPPQPAVSLELKGGKVVVTRANIMVNRTVDLGVSMEIFSSEVRLNEFVKATKQGVGTEFDFIDVVSTVGGLEPGEYSLVYFDVDGKEAFNGKFAVK